VQFKSFDFGERMENPPEPTPDEEILEELRVLKKLSRKQGLLMEKLREEFLEQSTRKLNLDHAPLLTFADAFFYLDRSFHGPAELSPERRQAFEMVWQTLDEALAVVEILMIREIGVTFDERLHEAVANLSPEGKEPQVLDVIQPGYAHNGRVLKAARVVVGLPAAEMLEQCDNESEIMEETETDGVYHLRN